MRRIILIIIAIVVIGAIGYVWFAYLRPQSSSPASVATGGTAGGNAGGSVTNVSADKITPFSPNGIPPGNTVSIGTPEGIVIVSNFYKTAIGTDGRALVLRKTSGYEIIYNAEESAFGIYVLASPVASEEATAEQNLLSVLDISQQDACKLNVTWGVSPSVDPSRAGATYGLSFCPGSTGL